MAAESGNKVWIKQAADLFEKYIGQFGEHVVASGDEVYQQPYVDLSLHLIQMHVQGWVSISMIWRHSLERLHCLATNLMSLCPNMPICGFHQTSELLKLLVLDTCGKTSKT